MSHPPSRARSRSMMRSGGCDRSASITTTRSKRARRIPNRTDRDRSRGISRRVSMRTGKCCASSATTASLASSESSSVITSSTDAAAGQGGVHSPREGREVRGFAKCRHHDGDRLASTRRCGLSRGGHSAIDIESATPPSPVHPCRTTRPFAPTRRLAHARPANRDSGSRA